MIKKNYLNRKNKTCKETVTLTMRWRHIISIINLVEILNATESRHFHTTKDINEIPE